MRSQKVIESRLSEVSSQIRDTAKTASTEEWDRLHMIFETLAWVLNVPTEKV